MKNCNKCPQAHKSICEKTGLMCALADDHANGNIPCQEKLAKPDRLQHLPQSDYNDTIYELMRDREARDIDRLDAIRSISDLIPTMMRKKAILSMMLADITQRNIAELLHLSQGRIAQISKARIAFIK
jgi:DNA-directed RNA polymerase specialized sigma subunit